MLPGTRGYRVRRVEERRRASAAGSCGAVGASRAATGLAPADGPENRPRDARVAAAGRRGIGHGRPLERPGVPLGGGCPRRDAPGAAGGRAAHEEPESAAPAAQARLPRGKTAVYVQVKRLRPQAARPIRRFEGVGWEFSQHDFAEVGVATASRYSELGIGTASQPPQSGSS